MPSLETPPNSAPPTQPVKVRTGRYGELEEHELIHLLDSLDDERSKARFRESIYISLIIYLGIVWFLFYGPRVLFHQPRLISPVDVLKERDKQLTFLDSPKDLSRLSPKPKAVTEKNQARPLDQKTLRQLEAMRKAEAPAPAPTQPAPAQAAPTPPAPQPPPGPIAHVADNRLNDQAGQGSGQPQQRQLICPRTKIFVDRAHVGELEIPAELDSEKPYAHVDDLPSVQARLLHTLALSLIDHTVTPIHAVAGDAYPAARRD